MDKLIAYCGLNCEKCEARIATITEDQVLREKVSKEWSVLNNFDITPDMILCDGCRADGRKTIFCEQLCPIRHCAMSKNVNSCGDCEELDHCETIQAIMGGYEEAHDNLKKEQ